MNAIRIDGIPIKQDAIINSKYNVQFENLFRLPYTYHNRDKAMYSDIMWNFKNYCCFSDCNHVQCDHKWFQST